MLVTPHRPLVSILLCLVLQDPDISILDELLVRLQLNACSVFARNRDTAVPAEGNGDLQTLICVFVARPRRCLTLSNPVP